MQRGAREAQLTPLRDQLTKVLAHAEGVEQRVKASEATAVALQTTVTSLQEQLVAKEDEVTMGKDALVGMTAELARVQEEMMNKMGEIASKEKELVLVKGELENHQGQLSKQSVTLAESEAAGVIAQSTIASLARQLEEQTTIIEKLQSEVQQECSKVRALAVQLVSAEEASEQALEEHAAFIAFLQGELEITHTQSTAAIYAVNAPPFSVISQTTQGTSMSPLPCTTTSTNTTIAIQSTPSPSTEGQGVSGVGDGLLTQQNTTTTPPCRAAMTYPMNDGAVEKANAEEMVQSQSQDHQQEEPSDRPEDPTTTIHMKSTAPCLTSTPLMDVDHEDDLLCDPDTLIDMNDPNAVITPKMQRKRELWRMQTDMRRFRQARDEARVSLSKMVSKVNLMKEALLEKAAAMERVHALESLNEALESARAVDAGESHCLPVPSFTPLVLPLFGPYNCHIPITISDSSGFLLSRPSLSLFFSIFIH